MILHTLNAAPGSTAFSDCLRLLKQSDILLLLGDGTYAALKGTDACSELKNSGAEIYLLEPDARAAGIVDRLDMQFKLVDFDTFAALSERCPTQQAWY